METRQGPIQVVHSARGIPKYSLELWHDGLKKHKIIRDGDRGIVRRKAEIQAAEWSERWLVVDGKNREQTERISGKAHLEKRKASALVLTEEAQKELENLSSLLTSAIASKRAAKWDDLKDKTKFAEPQPAQGIVPHPPEPTKPSVEPNSASPAYSPKLGIFDKLISSRKDRLIAEKIAMYRSDHDDWMRQTQELNRQHGLAMAAHNEEVIRIAHQHRLDLEAWNKRQSEFSLRQQAQHAQIEIKNAQYLSLDPDTVCEFFDLVLSSSLYADYFPKEFDLEYQADAKILLVDYCLPAPDNLPTKKSVKYVAARDELEDQHISEVASLKQYDDVIYQVVLRSIHELFAADKVGALATVVLNGIVTSVDRSTGKEVTACVLSLRANRDEFLAVNLAQVDPKACFKSLKGVGSSKLHGLSPVPPIMPLRRDDGRFVSAYEVANTLDESVNLAAMDWEDFEHLIREVFAAEFSSTGGEVKVTQASRDGGVDAIAFDPDPIRGGKIVIQAKRYTNTVGVGAVRDLYGTVMNEGATKGVLVTTSDYGPDSYSFAAGKPLVLLSGANLLHMLEKHGHRARIDINEAKKLAAKG